MDLKLLQESETEKLVRIASFLPAGLNIKYVLSFHEKLLVNMCISDIGVLD